jgi:hypothetical protein
VAHMLARAWAGSGAARTFCSAPALRFVGIPRC